jgi:hypothetical protein
MAKKGMMSGEVADGWRAESDMRTIAQAQEIMADGTRLKAARAKAIETMKSLMPLACAGSMKAKTSKSKGSGNRLSMR